MAPNSIPVNPPEQGARRPTRAAVLGLTWIIATARLAPHLASLVLITAAAACATNPTREATTANLPIQPGYRASGNEPFWTLTFDERSMHFTSLGRGDTISAPLPEAERRADGWRFAATTNAGVFAVTIEDRRCGDSMSGRPFPHTVVVTVQGETFTGCGGDTASLLTGEEWRVTSLDGTATSEGRRPTLRFGEDGVLTGDGGCNRYRASYEITGEGIAIGPAVATRMACAEPELNTREVRFFALLEQVTRFEIAEDGRLELLANDRTVVIAQR